MGFALAIDAYARHNYEVMRTECVERRQAEFIKMLKQTKITVNERKIGYYGFDDSADHVITLSVAKTNVKLPMLHLSFKNLIKFDASYNNMEKIDDIGNETFPYLRLFNLSHNAISSVKSYVFSHLKEVEILDLSHNCFVEFHYDIVFLKHEKLKELYLHDNLLHQIHSLMQEPKVMTLDFLDISNNFIQSFTNFDIEIKHLEMTNNALESVKMYHGDQMILNAATNKITSFLTLASFKLLNLSHNEISFFSDIQFKEALTLDLSYNKIKKFDEFSSSFEDEILTGENESSEKISSENSENVHDAKQIFDVLRTKVEHLSLAYNNLSEITELAIYKDCKTLNLEGNMLKNIDLEKFRELFPLLKRVNLINNPLSAVDENDLKYFNTTQFLQLHFDYSFATKAPIILPTLLPTLLPIFLPPFHPTKPSGTSTPKIIDKIETRTERQPRTSSHMPTIEPTTHSKSMETTVETHHANSSVKPLNKNSSKVWIFALVFVAVIVLSMICLNYRKQKWESRGFSRKYNEAENYF